MKLITTFYPVLALFWVVCDPSSSVQTNSHIPTPKNSDIASHKGSHCECCHAYVGVVWYADRQVKNKKKTQILNFSVTSNEIVLSSCSPPRIAAPHPSCSESQKCESEILLLRHERDVIESYLSWLMKILSFHATLSSLGWCQKSGKSAEWRKERNFCENFPSLSDALWIFNEAIGEHTEYC